MTTTEQGKAGPQPNADASSGDDDATTANTNADSSEANSGGGREARYRVERNEARAEVERLSGVVHAMQRAEVERLVDAEGLKARAFWSGSGVDLADLLVAEGDAAGTVDVEKVAEAIGVAGEELGIEAPGPRSPLPGVLQGRNGAGDGDGADKRDGFVQAFAAPGEHPQ